MQFLRKIWPNNGLAPHLGGGGLSLLQEILGPPSISHTKYQVVKVSPGGSSRSLSHSLSRPRLTPCLTPCLTLGGGLVCRWWGHLTTIGGNRSFLATGGGDPKT